MENRNLRNAEYIDSYNKWFSNLSTEQKKTMKEQGIDKPLIDIYTTKQKFDVSEMYIPDTYKEYDYGKDAKIFSQHDVIEIFGRAMEFFLYEMLSKRNVSLTAECMLFILGKSIFSTEQEIAEAYHMTRSNVSARCIELKDKFGLENSSFGKNFDFRYKHSKSKYKVNKS